MNSVWVVELIAQRDMPCNQIIGEYHSCHLAEVELYNYLRSKGWSRDIYEIEGNRYSECYYLHFYGANSFKIEEFALDTKY